MKKIKIILLGLLVVFATGGCDDPWEDRFDKDAIPESSVWETLLSNPQYSGFVDLLQQTGYDTILQRNTAFSVFVPTGSSFPDANNLTEEQKRNLVSFHISNSVLYSKDIRDGVSQKSLNGKNLFFESAEDGLQINKDVTLEKTDILASNGVIHEINQPLIFRPNLLNFIDQEEEFAYVAEFFEENTSLIFDQENSIPVGINDNGQTVYDTIWRASNDFFDEVADIVSEDQQFTMFLANNVLLDTADQGELKPGYLSGIGGFILDGFYEENDLGGMINAIDGKVLPLQNMEFNPVGRASNGMIYRLSSFAGLAIPKPFEWEITSISDFDSIRDDRMVNYASILDQLQGINVYDIDGTISTFSYAFDPRALNGDYLRIQTVAGTSASMDIHLPDFAPGEYNLQLNAMIRVEDGFTFDVYFNNELIKEDVTLRSGNFFIYRGIRKHCYAKN